MALVKIRGSRDEVLTEARALSDFLAPHGISYRQWDTARVPQALRGLATLDDAQKAHVLSLYKSEIDAVSRENGYVTADVVSLSPDNPKLAEICAKFDKEHTHDEDEVRFVVGGHGTFTVRGRQGEAIDITMGAGDFISVPRDRRHWFTLLDDKTIVTVRLFQDTKGWTPHYAGSGTGATEVPRDALVAAFGAHVILPATPASRIMGHP
jgi:1,2-dihydroxy-3-keto-5-methylthiopentene dioxygenase